MLTDTLSKNDRIDKIDNVINLTQANYISNIGSSSKKGFNSYKNFIRSMESKRVIEENKTRQNTVWNKIERYEKRKKRIE